MLFEPPLIRAKLKRRYKRFLADILLEDGTETTAHCANPGAMTGLQDEGQTIWVQPSTNPKRKLKYSWILVDHGDAYTGVDTSLPNKLVAEALAEKHIPELAPYGTILREQKYGTSSRIDFLLKEAGLPDLYLEIKSVTLKRADGLAEFPDTVTARGAKHLDELAGVKAQGNRAMMLYVIQRTDCTGFDLARDIDPTYAKAFLSAQDGGVETLAYATEISPRGITIAHTIPFVS